MSFNDCNKDTINIVSIKESFESKPRRLSPRSGGKISKQRSFEYFFQKVSLPMLERPLVLLIVYNFVSSRLTHDDSTKASNVGRIFSSALRRNK